MEVAGHSGGITPRSWHGIAQEELEMGYWGERMGCFARCDSHKKLARRWMRWGMNTLENYFIQTS